MKKKNGFTLVELLITITLMLMILVLAIISFNRISKNKKEESWETVKLQVEAAAKDYFIANEYLFKGLSDGASGSITVGKLVEEDYLNKVTNPITGKSVDECTKIEVKKNGNKYTAKYDGGIVRNSDGTCINKYLVETAEPGAPAAKISYQYKINDETKEADSAPDWFNNTHDEPKLIVRGISNGNGPIKSIQILEEITNGDNATYKIEDETIGKNVQIIVTNTSNKKYTVITRYRRDVTPPSIEYANMNVSPNSSWNGINTYDAANNPQVQIKASDGLSGIDTVLRLEKESFIDKNDTIYYFNSNYGERTEHFAATDKAGNKATTTGNYIVSSAPSCPSFSVDATFGDDGSTIVSNAEVYIDLNDGETFNGTINNRWDGWSEARTYSNVRQKTDALLNDGSYYYVGSISNKYGITTYNCSSDTYNRDTTPPVCPAITYDVTKKKWEKQPSDWRYGISAGNLNEVCPLNQYGVYECSKNVRVKVWASPSSDTAEIDWYTNNGPGDYVLDVKNDVFALTSYWSTWRRGCPIGGVSGQDGCGSWPKMLSSSNVNDGYRQGLFVVRDDAGNENYCLTDIFHLNLKGSEGASKKSCYNKSKLKYSGTKGDNGWYKSDVKVKKGDTTLCTITEEGKNATCTYKIGDKICTSGSKKVDKTKPTMNITYGPKRETCNEKHSIHTKYTAKDTISGLAIVKDYYGTDKDIPGPGSIYWRNRSITSGTKSYNHDHNWGPTCTTMGTPVSGTCYKLKYYLKDKAGNVNSGMTSNCAKY